MRNTLCDLLVAARGEKIAVCEIRPMPEGASFRHPLERPHGPFTLSYDSTRQEVRGERNGVPFPREVADYLSRVLSPSGWSCEKGSYIWRNVVGL